MASVEADHASAAPAQIKQKSPPALLATGQPTPPPSQSGTEPKVSMSAETPVDMSPPFSPSSTTPVLEKDDVDLDFAGNIDVNDNLPTDEELKRVDNLLVLDAKGQSRPFNDLYKAEGVAPRQLIIFVRHFFCGNCQEYLRTLSSSITPESLLALDQPAFITVIGCGRPELINMYVETTNCPFPVYADPTRKLYDILGMTRTFDLGKKPGYIQSNLFVTSVQSIIQGIKTGNKAMKGGDFKQVGGEFLFEEGRCVWVHRMRNTRDHSEVTEVRRLVGLDDRRPPMRKRWSHSVKKAAEGKEKDRKEKKVEIGEKEEKEHRFTGRMRSKSWGKVSGRVRSKSRGAKGATPEPDLEEKEEEMTLNGRPTV